MKKKTIRNHSVLLPLMILLMLAFAGLSPVYALDEADSNTVGKKVPIESVSCSWTSPFTVNDKEKDLN